MTFIKTPPGDTVIKRPDFGTSVRMRKPALPEAAPASGAAAPREVRVFVDGADSGLLPQDVTELHLGAGEDCLVRLDHDGASPVGAGEFEFSEFGSCAETEITYAAGDSIGTLPACSSTMDIAVECAPSDPENPGSPLIPWLIVRDSELEIIASQPLDGVLPPIGLIINGVNVGTVSRCATEIEVTASGTCEPDGESCYGSGNVTVDDGQGGTYNEGFVCGY